MVASRGDSTHDRPARPSLPVDRPIISVVAWAGALVFVASLIFFLYSYVVRFRTVPEPGPRLGAILVNLTLFTAFALHHSLFARVRLKAWVRTVAPPALERSLYTWIASISFIIVCQLWVPVPGVLYRLEGLWAWAASVAQVSGILLAFFGSKAIDVLDLAGVRAVQRARGGDPGRHVPLTTSGVYGVVRHPLYFGWALLVFGAPHMTATRAVFAIISTAYLAIAIPWEERSLIETFGADYRAYQTQVRWRMIPGLY
jgi:methanethiol S-methyltransferase